MSMNMNERDSSGIALLPDLKYIGVMMLNIFWAKVEGCYEHT